MALLDLLALEKALDTDQEETASRRVSDSQAEASNKCLNSPEKDSSIHTRKAWSRSHVELYPIVHEWAIENFLELDKQIETDLKVGSQVARYHHAWMSCNFFKEYILHQFDDESWYALPFLLSGDN